MKIFVTFFLLLTAVLTAEAQTLPPQWVQVFAMARQQARPDITPPDTVFSVGDSMVVTVVGRDALSKEAAEKKATTDSKELMRKAGATGRYQVIDSITVVVLKINFPIYTYYLVASIKKKKSQ